MNRVSREPQSPGSILKIPSPQFGRIFCVFETINVEKSLSQNDQKKYLKSLKNPEKVFRIAAWRL